MIEKNKFENTRKTRSAETSVCVVFGALVPHKESKTTSQGPPRDRQGTPKETLGPTLCRVKTLLNVLKHHCA